MHNPLTNNGNSSSMFCQRTPKGDSQGKETVALARTALNMNAINNGTYFVFAFTGGLWLYYANGLSSCRNPSSASSYPASPG